MSKTKLWEGRISKETNAAADDFNRSISFDRRLWLADLKGSRVHAEMLAKQGIISDEDKKAIIKGLKTLDKNYEHDEPIDESCEDIHTYVEQELTKLTPAGKKLHTARSRNDQVATDFRLWCRQAVETVQDKIGELLAAIERQTRASGDAVMPGYTHLQRAQPITLAIHLAAWNDMLRQDKSRLFDAAKRINRSPLGAGALAGTTFNIDRDFTAHKLGFKEPIESTLAAVGDRDFALELLSCFAILMTHLSRMAEEVILWTTAEFGFAVLDDSYSTGSSMMPQKKNPDMAELVRGKTGRVIGDLVSLLVTMKALPLAYNKDMQEDKPAVFDSFDTVTACLGVFAGMLATMSFNRDVMRQAAAYGFTNATDAADYLVRKGVPFRDAYKTIGKLVSWCVENDHNFETIPLKTLKQADDHFERDFYSAVRLETCVENRRNRNAD